MARPGRLAEIAEEHEEDLETLIPRKLNELETIDAVARELRCSFKTVYRYVKDSNLKRRVVWVKEEPEHA